MDIETTFNICLQNKEIAVSYKWRTGITNGHMVESRHENKFASLDSLSCPVWKFFLKFKSSENINFLYILFLTYCHWISIGNEICNISGHESTIDKFCTCLQSLSKWQHKKIGTKVLCFFFKFFVRTLWNLCAFAQGPWHTHIFQFTFWGQVTAHISKIRPSFSLSTLEQSCKST